MPLLNPPDILPEAMRFLVRALVSSPGRQLSREELLALVAPTGLVEAMDSLGGDAEELSGDESDLKIGGRKIAEASLTALRTLELVEPSGDPVVLSSELGAWKSYKSVTPGAFAHVMLNAFIKRASKTTPEEGDPVGDLREVLGSLYAASDPLWPFVTFEPGSDLTRRSFGQELDDRLGDDRSLWPIPNVEQYRTFERLAPYLGLARMVGRGGLIADASVALQNQLPSDMAGEYGVADFVAICARAVPLLDGGSMQKRYDDEGDRPISGGHAVLSPVLSLTLLQFEVEGRVTLKRLSDVGLRSIRVSASGEGDRAVSHVTWLPRSRGKGGKA